MVVCITNLRIFITVIFINCLPFIPPAFSQRFQSENSYEIYQHYANTYPDHGQPHWGNHEWATQGIAHDSLNWYFSTHNYGFLGKVKHDDFVLYRIPADYDINDFDTNQPGVEIFQLSKNLSPKNTLRKKGYGHIGDIDYCEHNGIGYIAAPLTGKDGPPIIAFFLSSNLYFVHYSILDTNQQKSVGWCAFSNDGFLYTSDDDTDRILRYAIDWDAILNKNSEFGITFDTSFIFNKNNEPIVKIRHMQGGDFTPSGELLYISCGIVSCLGKGESNSQDGIYIFETKNWNQVLRSSNTEMYPESADIFDFKFNNTDCNDELEGLTIWDVDHLKIEHRDKLRGQLHVVLDNHNKYQIIRNICEYGKWLNPAYTSYKISTSIYSYFKRSKPHTSKVSVQHFGPYKYDSVKEGGAGELSEQDIIDITLLEEAYQFLLKGDTLGMISYLADHLNEEGFPVQQSVTNPYGGKIGNERPSASTTCWYNRGTFREILNGYCQFKYCKVQSSPNCGYCLQNYQNNFGITIPLGDLSIGNLILSYIDIAEKRNYDFDSPNNLIPFSLENSVQSWMASEADEFAEYNFKFIVPGKSYAWLATSSGSPRPIRSLDSWLFQSTGNNDLDDKRKLFLYNIANVAAQDPDFEMIEKPTPNNLRAVITGNYKGFPYLLGVSDNSYFTPVNLTGDVDASRRLIAILKSGNTLLSPLDNIVKDWHLTGKERAVVACVEGGSPRKYRNPDEAWKSGVGKFSGNYSPNLAFILSDGKIIGKGLGEIDAPEFYKVRDLNNSYLAMLFVADPYCLVLKREGRKIALLTGSPDDLYILEVPQDGGTKPEIRAVLSRESKKEVYLRYMVQNKRIHPNLEHYF